MKIRYRPRALADIDEIFEFINTRSPAVRAMYYMPWPTPSMRSVRIR